MNFFRGLALFSFCLSLYAMDSRIEIGENYTYVWIESSDERKSRGSLGGAQAMYEYRPLNRFYGGSKLSWREGDTKSSVVKRSLLYIDTQERLGYTFYWQKSDALLTLFSGFGFRYLQQHVKQCILGAESFNSSFFPPFLTSATDTKLKYYEFYIPVGAAADFKVRGSASIGIYLTWMPQLFPIVDIVPSGHAYWALSNRLANFLLEIPFTFALTQNRRCFLTLKPTYEYWQDGHSTAKTSTGISLNLPGNTYQFVAGDINFTYIF